MYRYMKENFRRPRGRGDGDRGVRRGMRKVKKENNVEGEMLEEVEK